MKRPRALGTILAILCAFLISSTVHALANRVFVSARSGNDANTCDSVLAPCQTFAGAVTKLNPGGEAIVLDSGGYGPVTITKSLTIEAPPGVTAFIHPPSGDAITINAGSTDTVVLRGLVLNGGSGSGILANTVGTLHVENCVISGFGGGAGLAMFSAGRLNVNGTDVRACAAGIEIAVTSGSVQASVDHCHLDGNLFGYITATSSPGSSTTTATNSTANNNTASGWSCGSLSGGMDVLNLEFCTGSENSLDGLAANSVNALSLARYSNCVFANNGQYGVDRSIPVIVETRGNNTITDNASGDTHGSIGTFLAK